MLLGMDNNEREELNMIQDIAPHTYHNEYHTAEPSDGSPVFICGNRTVLLKIEDSQLVFPLWKEVRASLPDASSRCRFLFSINGIDYFGIIGDAPQPFCGYTYERLSFLRTAQPQHLAYAGMVAHQLLDWYRTSRFCGACGAENIHSDTERAMVCPVCGRVEYPRIAPAVIVGILHNGKLLLSRYQGREYKKFALIAGYAEIGETIEQTVHREVMEEVGLRVKNLRYYKCQPWPLSGTLLFGFYCDLDGTDEITLDQNELAMAQWYRPEEIDLSGDNISLTKEMITRFCRGEIC